MSNSTIFSRTFVRTARILLGLVLVAFGLNGFVSFLPQPDLPEPAGRFIGALVESGYLFQLTHAVELIVGVLLLIRRYVPLALVVLAPISVNIAAFHLALDPAGFIGPAALVALLNLYLLFAYRPAYAPLLRSRVTPVSAEAVPVSATEEG